MKESVPKAVVPSNAERVIFHFFLDEILHGIKIILTCFIIGTFFRSIPETLVFLSIYPLLRHYIGGLHAETRLKCYLATVCTYGIALWMYQNMHPYFVVVLALICAYSILKIGIVEHPNHILTLAQKEIFTGLQRQAVLYFLCWGIFGVLYFQQLQLFKMLLNIIILNGGNLIMFKRLMSSLSTQKLSQHAMRLATAFVLAVGAGAMSGVTCVWNYQPEVPAEVDKYLNK